MAVYNLRCCMCDALQRRFADSVKDLPNIMCMLCGGLTRREGTGPSTSVKERLDNGSMPRALERFADAERLHHERAAAADPLAGGGKLDR